MWWALGAFAGWGLQQALLASQGYLREQAGLQSLRIPVVTTASLLVWLVGMVWRQSWPRASAWWPGMVGAVCSLAGYGLMFRGLDVLRPTGAAGVFFPVAVGTNVVAFACYSMGTERWTKRSLAGLALGVAGLLAIGVT